MTTLALLLLAAPAVAAPSPQGGARPVDGTRFGRSVFTLSDLDGDGVPEFAVGAPAARNCAGRILVFSGRTREVLDVWHPGGTGGFFGHSMRAAGDADGDGVVDVLVGKDYAKGCEVRSGKTGAPLALLEHLESQVHPFGDFDGDGRADVLVTIGRSWEVRAGDDGERLAGPLAGPEEGTFHAVGDFNGDGLTDGVLAGENAYLCPTTRRPAGGGEALPLPFDSASPLFALCEPPLDIAESALCVDATTLGDLDGDRITDVFFRVGARRPGSNGPLDRIRAIALSPGADDPVLGSWIGGLPYLSPDRDGFGYSACALDDIDGDGVVDLAFAEAIDIFTVSMSVRSGRTGAGIWERKVEDIGVTTGLCIEPFVDVDEDGVRDVLVGASHYYWSGRVHPAGRVTLVSGRSGEELWVVRESDVRESLTAPKRPR